MNRFGKSCSEPDIAVSCENLNSLDSRQSTLFSSRNALIRELAYSICRGGEANAEEMEGDEMLPAAVEVILETGQASVSMLQRRLKLGYARAARIVDEMEEKGIVGPFQGSKPRAILITKEQWATQKGGTNQQMAFEDLDTDMEGVPEDV